MAQVLHPPFRPAPTTSTTTLAANSVDEWGRDPHLIAALRPLARLRWSVSVGGAHHLPTTGGALLVANARRFALGSLFASWALGEATGRPVRFVGRPDIAPIGPLMRRLGALLDDADEVGSALRNGELVMISAAPTNHARHAGAVDHRLVAAAVLSGRPVFPVATLSSQTGRAARAEVAAAVRIRRRRRGPLAEVELADAVQRQLQKLLEEMGGMRTGVLPLDWLGQG